MPHLKDVRLKGQRIELRLEPKDTEHWYLGPNLELSDCELFLWVNGRDLILRRPRIFRSKVWAKKAITKVPFFDAGFDECQFLGTFRGCDFGSRPGEEWPGGGVQACDFRDAALDDCRFVSCSIDGLRFAAWPTVVFHNPVQHAPEFASLRWPGARRVEVYASALGSSPKETKVFVAQAKTLVRMLGGDEQSLRAALQTLPWVQA